jgi:hypothetical protein
MPWNKGDEFLTLKLCHADTVELRVLRTPSRRIVRYLKAAFLMEILPPPSGY